MISVTKVELSKDIKTAKIYLSIFSNNNDLDINDIYKKILENKNSIKFKMGLQLKSKYVPEIEFAKDDSMKNYDHINKLLKNDE